MTVIAKKASGISVVGIPIEQRTLPAMEAIEEGDAVRIDPTTGHFRLAAGDNAGTATYYGIALSKVGINRPVTAVRRGDLYGWDVDAKDFNTPVYLSDTDGKLDDGAGTVSVTIGRVAPHTAVPLGTSYGKLIRLDPSNN